MGIKGRMAREGISPGTEVLCGAEEMDVEFRTDFETLLALNNATITR